MTLEDAFVFKYMDREEKQTLAGSRGFKHGIPTSLHHTPPHREQDRSSSVNAEQGPKGSLVAPFYLDVDPSTISLATT